MDEVPEWSGAFWTYFDKTRAVMEVHVSDTRTHEPPPGWKLEHTRLGEDSEVFVYRRIV